ncbi:MAG: YgeY family selenium metabolism-linked hydrolase [Firmicutes bacterium]|nr:YgeY family selenium metabolism-linked hydrolase [Bacillota bacterium]
MTPAVLRAAGNYSGDMVRFLRDIVAIPSQSCHEGPVVERVLSEMKAIGFDETYSDRIGNAIGRIGSGPLVIMYDAHLDTVGVGDPSAWDYDPYEGKFEDGRVYGLGTVDMKAAMASMAYGGRIIKEMGLDRLYTLYVAGIVQEEDCDGFGSRVFVQNLPRKPDLVVLGEPTNLRICRGHRGRCEIKVVLKGRACHASAPERGENAVYKMAGVLRGIEELQSRLKDDPFLGKGTIAVTRIESKSGSLNVVPDECTTYIDRRLTWGEDSAGAISEIKALPGAEHAHAELLTYEEPSYTGYVERVPKDFPTWITPEDHPTVAAAIRTAELLFGEKPAVDKWVFSTNGVTLAGQLKIPTIGFGPGDEALAHTVNEYVTVEHLVKAAAFYALFPTVISQSLGEA